MITRGDMRMVFEKFLRTNPVSWTARRIVLELGPIVDQARAELKANLKKSAPSEGKGRAGKTNQRRKK